MNEENKLVRRGLPLRSSASRSTRRNHVLDIDDYSVEEIEEVLNNTEVMKEILNQEVRKLSLLRGKSIVTLFFEPSTRTRISFEQAGKILGADVINVSSHGSSVEKGESLYNTALTLQAMKCDVVVLRHSHAGAPYFLSRYLESAVINAGDGFHAHPTQALIDLYTINSHLGSIKGVKVVIVGDYLYSRVARSNILGLSTMGARVVVCAPPTLMPSVSLENNSIETEGKFPSITVETDLEKALDGADVVMTLRLQSERQQAGHLPTLREYSKLYGITEERLRCARPNVLIMHPGPMNEGVELDSRVAHCDNSVIEDQVTNGVAVRMAILFSIFSTTNEINKD